MGNKIQIAGITTANKKPTAAEVAERELVVNLRDGRLWSKDENGLVFEISPSSAIVLADNLTETVTGKALDAHQGKVLKDMIDAINTLLSSDDTSLDELQEIVTYIKQNKTELENLSVGNIAGLQDALDSKEDAFTKNTAFNKDFGTGAGQVAEGNHVHDAGYYMGEEI